MGTIYRTNFGLNILFLKKVMSVFVAVADGTAFGHRFWGMQLEIKISAQCIGEFLFFYDHKVAKWF